MVSRLFNIFVAVVTLFAIFSLKTFEITTLDKISFLSAIMLIFAVLHLVLDYYSLGRRFVITPYNIFFTALFIFNLGYSITNGFPGGPKFTDIPVDESIIFRAVEYVSLSIVVFSLGYLLFCSPRGVKGGPVEIEGFFRKKEVRTISVLLLLLSLPFLVYELLNKIILVSRYGYLGYYKNVDDSSLGSIISSFSSFAIMMLLVCIVLFKGEKTITVLLTLAFFLATALNIMLGFRAGGMLPFLVYLYIRDRYIRKVNYIGALPIVLLTFIIVFPIIAEYRDFIGQSNRNLGSENESGLIGIIRELGRTFQATAYTMKVLDFTNEFRLGWSYVGALGLVLPSGVLGIDVESVRPSVWLVSIVDPVFKRAGGGLGFSMIAESYYNFGILGGLAAMFLQGILIGKLSEISLFSRRYILGLLAAAYMSVLVFYVRQEAVGVVRGFFWFVVGTYAAYLITCYRGNAVEARRLRELGGDR